MSLVPTITQSNPVHDSTFFIQYQVSISHMSVSYLCDLVWVILPTNILYAYIINFPFTAQEILVSL